MFRRKLDALDYQNAEKFSIYDESEFKSIIVWLEDQKIRHYKIEDRADLRNMKSPSWANTFKQYLVDVGCPYSIEDKKTVLDWLLGFAVRLEFGDNVEKYKAVTAENVKKNAQNVPRVVQSNPLDNLDFESEEFKVGVATIARLLQVSSHPDHLVTLQAICTLVKTRLSNAAIACANVKKGEEGKPFPLKESSLGFETGDYVLNHAAKILRFLYLHDLRDLQTRINEAIVAAQNITANPKTDTRLGKVGR